MTPLRDALAEQITDDYTVGGLAIGAIAARVGRSYGFVHRILAETDGLTLRARGGGRPGRGGVRESRPGPLAVAIEAWVASAGRTVAYAEILAAFGHVKRGTVASNLSKMVARGALMRPRYGHYTVPVCPCCHGEGVAMPEGEWCYCEAGRAGEAECFAAAAAYADTGQDPKTRQRSADTAARPASGGRIQFIDLA